MNRCLLLVALFLGGMPAIAQESGGSQPLALEDCRIRAGEGFPGIKARCGTLLRPEDPANPDSPMLELYVAVVPALSLEPEPDAFVPIAGGPGQASTEFYASYASAFEQVRRHRDIVLIDQRGTGRSAKMHCDTEDDVISGEFSRARTIEETESCLASLPHDPRFFTTSVAVRDLEALRVALGYTQFNLYGISYGSRVAQHFLRRYPDSTRTVILDGVVPPQIALGPGIAIEAQNAMDAIFDRCAEEEACAARFPDIRSRFEALRGELADNPVTVAMPNPSSAAIEEISFGDRELAGAMRLLSYHPSSVALMPLLIDEAAEGNLQPVAAQFQMIADAMADAMSIGMHNSVVCTEDAPYFENEDVSVDELEATYIGPVQLEVLDAICSIWPQGVLDPEFKTPVSSDTPVLLLSGEADPITPPAYAELAAVELADALLLTGRRQGHGQAPQGCMPGIIRDFVEAGASADIDTECLDRMFAMPFFLDFSGPAP